MFALRTLQRCPEKDLSCVLMFLVSIFCPKLAVFSRCFSWSSVFWLFPMASGFTYIYSFSLFSHTCLSTPPKNKSWATDFPILLNWEVKYRGLFPMAEFCLVAQFMNGKKGDLDISFFQCYSPSKGSVLIIIYDPLGALFCTIW